MPTVYKNAQVQGTAGVTTYATLYNTSASATAVISTITVCNTASTAATYRIGIMGSAGTPGASEWIIHGATVAANDTGALTLGVTLGNSQFIRISSSANTVAFAAFVSEIT
jgi:CDP-diglyceride synthetase